MRCVTSCASKILQISESKSAIRKADDFCFWPLSVNGYMHQVVHYHISEYLSEIRKSWRTEILLTKVIKLDDQFHSAHENVHPSAMINLFIFASQCTELFSAIATSQFKEIVSPRKDSNPQSSAQMYL